MPIAALLCGLIGMGLYSSLIERFARSDAGLQIALTLGIAIMLENLVALFFGPDPITAGGAWPARASITFGDFRIDVSRLAAGMIGVAVITATWWLFERNRWGMAIQAAGENITGVELTGYSARAVLPLGFGLSTALAGLAGVLMLPVANVSPYDAVDFTLRSFVVVLVAGTSNIRGILLMGVLLGLLQSVGAYLASPDIGVAATYALLLLALWYRRKRAGVSTLSVTEH